MRPTAYGEIDLCRVSDEWPLLQATWYEVLRFYGTFTLGRHVRDEGDAVIASGYTLERDTFALTPLRLHHFDRVVWGEDSESQWGKSEYETDEGG
ncbi:cytochrome P450 [Colletotrichum sp. SAR11_240]|nr:cytochrome P450 [Colletotrichum sp. SAR11_240]